jgi:transketolase
MAKTPEEKKLAWKESKRKYRERHPERAREQNRKWREAHPDQLKEQKRRWYLANRDRVALQRRKYLYSILPDTYAQLLMTQNGVCAICGGNRNKQALGVDHNHITGSVRGLLCGKCNVIIGMADDDSGILRKAIEYLDAH